MVDFNEISLLLYSLSRSVFKAFIFVYNNCDPSFVEYPSNKLS
uniref:Uncharacterized protein n=1 Tax=Podoviridae sp. ctG4L18 TaxID=2825234 RepID=A0A8S5UP22_9CAUD|nr:MAG TPA: hypothetical protein [Podoviridae sp. ctG4L18]